MTFIIMMIILIYVIAIIWTWNSLGDIEKPKKILVIISAIALIYIITAIIYSFSKGEIAYLKIDIENNIRNVLIPLFAGMNCFILPWISRILSKVHEREIEPKGFKKSILIISIIFIIILMLECGYMNEIQQGILKCYQMKQ